MENREDTDDLILCYKEDVYVYRSQPCKYCCEKRRCFVKVPELTPELQGEADFCFKTLFDLLKKNVDLTKPLSSYSKEEIKRLGECFLAAMVPF